MNWPVAALVVVAAYGVAMPVGAWMSKPRASAAAAGHAFPVIQRDSAAAPAERRARQPASAAR